MTRDSEYIPHSIIKAFPFLSDFTKINHLHSSVPIVPDTTFEIFTSYEGKVVCLVITDYPDPLHQSAELHKISPHYTFVSLRKPYDSNKRIQILDHDDMDGDFILKDGATYYYVADIQS